MDRVKRIKQNMGDNSFSEEMFALPKFSVLFPILLLLLLLFWEVEGGEGGILSIFLICLCLPQRSFEF